MPTQVDESGNEYQTIFVQVMNAASVFQKDKLEWPDPKDDDHKDDPPKSFRIFVHGYDELGRRVCPIFEVPDCQEIQLAIHNEHVKDPETKKILYTGRLKQIMDKDLDKYPRWIGHPVLQDTPEEVVKKVLEIRKQQKVGDKILGLTKPSKLYEIKEPKEGDTEEDFKLWNLWKEGLELAKTPEKEKEKVAA